MIERLLLFGASGDLAGRFLLPALAALQAARKLPDTFTIVAAARQNWSDEMFRRHASERLAQHAAGIPAAARDAVVRSVRYQPADISDPSSVGAVVRGVAVDADAEPVAAYLALPPALFPAALTALGAAGLPARSRIAVEKPFGEDLASAAALNALTRKVLGERAEQTIFRVDHVLGMGTVQNLLAMRLANRLFDAVWCSAHIEEVDILWEETLALEGRAGYYDREGALKDVLQNHMLQVLSLMAMEPPASLGERDLRDRKVEALRAVRPLGPGDAEARTRRARYTAGRLSSSGGGGGRAVPSYVDERGVDPRRRTETFAEVVLDIDSARWAGTRFVLRTGKALSRRRKEVVLRFRPVSYLSLGGDDPELAANELRVGLDGPCELMVHLTGGFPKSRADLVPMTLTAAPPASELPPYGQVLLDILDGGCALSVRGDEAEEAWRIVTPIVQAWRDDRVPLEEYAAGSAGPPTPRIAFGLDERRRSSRSAGELADRETAHADQRAEQ